MSNTEEPKRTRNIKDLKARLGKGAPAPATTPQGGGSVPPPANIGGSGSLPPPSLGGGPGSAPPLGRRSGAPSAPADPFAASGAARPQEVRLVIDESAVKADEIGRGRRQMAIAAGIAGVVIGGGIVYAGLDVSGENALYTMSVRDGKDIYETVRTSSETVEKAQRFVKAAVTSAKATPGSTPSIDYEAITALRALEKPFQAGVFNRRRYLAFKPEVVDALFEYNTTVQVIWDRIQSLANKTLPPTRREALNSAATAMGSIATMPTGCVPMKEGERLGCGMVFITVPQVAEGEPPPTKVQVYSRRGSAQTYEKTIWTGQDLSEKPDDYVIFSHLAQSIGVLGEPASAFADYSRDLLELHSLMTRISEVQGRLLAGLGEVAKLEE